jgi:Holliday junction DNA helicase RuvB
MLLTGPPGVGKTTLAQLAAKETGTTLLERLGQVLANSSAVNGLLMEAKDKDIVFIDEIHEMPTSSQTLLYRAMEDRTVYVVGRDNRTLQLPVNDFVLIAASTDEYALLPPLRDRFKLILPFSWYHEQDLTTIIAQHATLTGVKLSDGVAANIAARSRGTPRLALRLMEACHRYARSQGDNQISEGSFTRAVELEAIDVLGLGTDDRRFLSLLASRPGQAIRLNTLSSSLGLHSRTLQTVIEPYLLRMKLIERTDKGRTITAAGLDHIRMMQDADAKVAPKEA